MKKLIVFLILLFPIKSTAISASSAIVMDMDNGRILYGYNYDEEKLIASITKIMTAIIAIEKGNLNDEIEVSDIIYKAHGSSLYVEVGEKLTLKDLLYGLMLRSGNDAALLIAKYISGSTEEFVFLMNDYADNLKMKNTIFYNPHGLEESNGNANKSSAYDMALLTKYAMENSTFREIFQTKKYSLKTNYKSYLWHNKNKLLSEDYITGGKTGFTKLARRTLVTTGSKDNINLIVVTLNDPNDWNDHKSLYNSIFTKYESTEILNKEKFIIKDEKYYQKDQLYIKNNYNLTLTKDELKKVKINNNLYKIKDYSSDMQVGFVEVLFNKKVLHKEPIYVLKKVEKKNLNVWQKFKRWLYQW